MPNILLITGSDGKAEEINKTLGLQIPRQKIDLPEIQSIEVEDVVAVKVQEAFRQVNLPPSGDTDSIPPTAVVVEDTGVYIEAWEKFPGALIKWMVDSVGLAGICRMLDPFDSRAAYVKTVIGFQDDQGTHIFIGETKGRIAHAPKGPGGFGWDKIFIPDGSEKTFGEMDLHEKNLYSMRRKALDKLRQFLLNQ